MPLAYNVRAFTSAPLTVGVNAKPALEKIARLGAGMRNPAPVVHGLARAMRQHIRTAFAVGGYPNQWVPNRPNTVAAKGHSKVLHRSKSGSGIEAATSVTVSEVGREIGITVKTSAIGRFHQEGRQGPWIIRARRAPFLSFIVAGPGRGASRGRPGRRARSGRGGAVRVYALQVVHPGYPARPFLPVMDAAFLNRHWRAPLYHYLFGQYK